MASIAGNIRFRTVVYEHNSRFRYLRNNGETTNCTRIVFNIPILQYILLVVLLQLFMTGSKYSFKSSIEINVLDFYWIKPPTIICFVITITRLLCRERLRMRMCVCLWNVTGAIYFLFFHFIMTHLFSFTSLFFRFIFSLFFVIPVSFMISSYIRTLLNINKTYSRLLFSSVSYFLA